jgi:ketosteroid isomerase-like protein
MFEDLPLALTIKSQDEFIDYLRSWTEGFSDASISNPQYADGPDHSVARFHARGFNDGDAGAIKATGRAIDVPFCEVLHYGTDGKVLSGEIYYDQLTMLVQLGVVQPPAPADAGMGSADSPSDLVHEMFAALDQLDFDALAASMTVDCEGIDELSRRWLRGSDEVLAQLREMESAISGIRSQISDLTERITGDTATVTCWVEQDYTYDGQDVHVSAPTTVGFRREGSRWKCCLFHSVPMTPE